jgi:hypothetical protein
MLIAQIERTQSWPPAPWPDRLAAYAGRSTNVV